MAGTIDAVISRLAEIVEENRGSNSPTGYFPALYRRVTCLVREGIENRAFEDNERMEELDVRFANRYINAYQAVRDGDQPSRSWSAAFNESENAGLTVLQHLLLGMNAHINFDLGIAAAGVADPRNPLSLKADFMKINALLGSLINDTQARLTRFFGPLGIIDRLLGPMDESLSLFSLEYARDKAWTQCLELLLEQDPDRRRMLQDSRDVKVAAFSRHLVRPPKRTVRWILRLVRAMERGTVSWRIEVLDRDQPGQPADL